MIYRAINDVPGSVWKKGDLMEVQGKKYREGPGNKVIGWGKEWRPFPGAWFSEPEVWKYFKPLKDINEFI